MATGNVSVDDKTDINIALGAILNPRHTFNFSNESIDRIDIDNTYDYNYVTGRSDANAVRNLGTFPTLNWCMVANFFCTHFCFQICVSLGDKSHIPTVFVRSAWCAALGEGSMADRWSKWVQLQTIATL